jgi:energy-coupling factor transporter ATP-binding protein EcfA2
VAVLSAAAPSAAGRIEPGAVVARSLGFTHAGAAAPALQDVDVDVAPGECLLVVGPSGSGKSTLVLALAGLLGREVPGSLEGALGVGGAVGVVFQDPGAQLVMERVEDDVAFGLENRGWPRPEMLDRVQVALAEVGLGGLGRLRTTTLSGGQQQRLALAGALAPHSRLLVLDEPTANLDPGGARAFVERLAALRAAGTTIVLVEHRVELAWRLADRVLVLGRDGRPTDLGTPSEVVGRSGRALLDAGIWLPDEVDAALGVKPRAAPPPAVLGEPLVAARGLEFGYRRGSPVVRDVDVEVAAGDRLTIVGPNGSGKSTLGRLLVGLLRPDAGTVRLDGDAPDRLRPAELARRAAYLFQDPEQQFLTTTVADEARLGLRGRELERLPELMDALALPLGVFATRSPYALSGGEQRRLSLAGILARRPRLLVLDEPTYGQDRATYKGLLGILRERLDDGVGVVAITHDERLVADLGGRSSVMSGGRLLDTGADGRIA